ncbi:MAG: TonB-dependent receptor [Bacteroidota bacterium]
MLRSAFCFLFVLALVAVLAAPEASAQTQTIRGVVLDRDTRAPLPGANVVLVDSDPLIGAATDVDGRFEIASVPLGRQTIQVRFLGYAPRILPNVLVRAGQETVLEIVLTEQLVEGAEVVVRAEALDGRPLDDLAAVSARSFSVEEAQRYAGAVDDPARLITAFAGVATSGSGVQDNAVAIRGNAPKGVGWRLEGVPIPTPSHFAGLTVAGGGGLTLFSGRLLSNSDVFTGAFPAEYGNALAGVFDMHFRTGNPATREHTAQIGVIGVEAASEGPIRRDGAATYLVNYRYSTLGLLMPLLPTEGTLTYQDLAFKLAFPTRHAGRFEVWGIGGLDAQSDVANTDSTEWEYDFQDRTEADLGLGVGAGGVTHHLTLGDATYLRTSAAATAQYTDWTQTRLDDDLVLQPELSLRSTDGRAILSSVLTHKFSPRHLSRSGVTAQGLFYDLDVRSALDNQPPLVPVAQGDGQTMLWQAFSQSRVTPVVGLDLSLGVHAQHLTLTGATAIEPRLGVSWAFAEGQALSLGYGLHSQAEDLRVYLAQMPDGTQPNQDLDFARAHHVVLGYCRALGEATRVQVEAYAQRLFDVPVVADSSFSLLNLRQDWTFAEPLVNDGAGTNVGVEVTLERALRNGFYALATASLFRSRYRGGDGMWRASRFDQGYAVNVLAGREFQLGRSNLLGLNVRVAALGGERRSPVDALASVLQEEVVFDETRAFDDRMPAIWLLDLTTTYRINGQRLSHVIALQLKNALAAKDTALEYNLRLDAVEEVREGTLLPVLSYTLEF